MINLATEIFPDATVKIDNSVVSMEGPIDEVTKTVAGFFYASFILPPKAHSSMLSKLSSLITTSKNRGIFKDQGRFAMPISRLVIKN